MNDYLTKLKTKKQATEVLPKLPKVPFGSKGSTQVGHFSEKNKSDHIDPAQIKKIPGLPDDLFQAPAVWIREEEKTWTPDTCPARCRRTQKCYGISFFDHRPGKALECQGSACPWMK